MCADARGGQKRALDPSALELQAVLRQFCSSGRCSEPVNLLNVFQEGSRVAQAGLKLTIQHLNSDPPSCTFLGLQDYRHMAAVPEFKFSLCDP